MQKRTASYTSRILPADIIGEEITLFPANNNKVLPIAIWNELIWLKKEQHSYTSGSLLPAGIIGEEITPFPAAPPHKLEEPTSVKGVIPLKPYSYILLKPIYSSKFSSHDTSGFFN